MDKNKFKETWNDAQELSTEHGLNVHHAFRILSGSGASSGNGASSNMDENTLMQQALAVRSARGGNLSQILRALRAHPEPARQSSPISGPPASGPVKYHQTSFFREVEKLMHERKIKYTDAYHAIRKQSPQLFESMLEAVNQ